ncbi:CO2+/MG2+ efflux protein ApaG [Rhabdaerophilaceae bacterium]
MYRAVTENIEVMVHPAFSPERSDPDSGEYFWTYTVRIRNLGQETVQLRSRHWEITDALGRVEHVRGAGVIGKQPVLKPGQSFDYTSGCPLRTSQGVMVGSYQMVSADGRRIEVAIPAFSLDTPEIKRVLN